MPSVSPDNHYYVDLSGNDEFTSYTSVYPEQLTFDHQIRGVGNIDFQLSYSALDQDGNLAVSGKDFIGPMRSYWRLRYGDIVIIAGVITKTNSKLGSDFMSITGKTWEHFMEIWQYPYDPRFDERTPGVPKSAPCYDYAYANSFQGNEITGSGRETPEGLAYEASNRDLILILGDIFSQTMNVPHRVIFDISSLANTSGIRTNKQYPLGDMSYMDSFINELSITGDGFDWWISWDKKFSWASPYRFGSEEAPVTFYFIDFNDAISGFLDELEFTNNGPRATHITGFGAGMASQTKFGRAYGSSVDQGRFTRYDADYDFGDVRNAAEMTAKTQKQLSLDLQPGHEIPISVDPESYVSGGARQFWQDWRVGRAFWITYDMGYHLIDSPQRIKSFSCNKTTEGSGLLALTLEQIYPELSSNAGSIEG